MLRSSISRSTPVASRWCKKPYHIGVGRRKYTPHTCQSSWRNLPESRQSCDHRYLCPNYRTRKRPASRNRCIAVDPKTYIWLTLLYSNTDALGFGFSFPESGDLTSEELPFPPRRTSGFSSLLPTDGGVSCPGTSTLSDSLSDEWLLPSAWANIMLLI